MLCSLSVFSISISTCQERKLLQFFFAHEISRWRLTIPFITFFEIFKAEGCFWCCVTPANFHISLFSWEAWDRKGVTPAWTTNCPSPGNWNPPTYLFNLVKKSPFYTWSAVVKYMLEELVMGKAWWWDVEWCDFKCMNNWTTHTYIWMTLNSQGKAWSPQNLKFVPPLNLSQI